MTDTNIYNVIHDYSDGGTIQGLKDALDAEGVLDRFEGAISLTTTVSIAKNLCKDILSAYQNTTPSFADLFTIEKKNKVTNNSLGSKISITSSASTTQGSNEDYNYYDLITHTLDVSEYLKNDGDIVIYEIDWHEDVGGAMLKMLFGSTTVFDHGGASLDFGAKIIVKRISSTRISITYDINENGMSPTANYKIPSETPASDISIKFQYSKQGGDYDLFIDKLTAIYYPAL